jgi:hypothetical protein
VITRVPILIGEGISLFGALPHDIALRHVATRTYKGGLVQSEYETGAAQDTTRGKKPARKKATKQRPAPAKARKIAKPRKA